MIRADQGPEGLVAMPLQSIRPHGHTWLRPLKTEWLMLEGVEDDFIDAHAEGPVGLVLQLSRTMLITDTSGRGKSFGPYHGTTHDMRNR